MREEIYNFPQQFNFSPHIENEKEWGEFKTYFLTGMGGSHLQGGVLKTILPDFPLFLHKDYGIPSYYKEGAGLIMASYSGNTEEVLDAVSMAISKGVSPAVVSKGGKLLEIAKENNLPFITLPDNNIQPRFGMGYSFKALIKILGVEDKLKEDVDMLPESLMKRQDELEKRGEEVALSLKGKTPIIYTSRRNEIIAYVCKVNFNETTKVPAFYNIVPELNHNEMNAYNPTPSTEDIIKNNVFIIFKDEDDHPRNRKRMEVLKEVLENRDLQVIEVDIKGKSRTEKVFSAIIQTGWISYYLAKVYNTDPEGVPMVEEFKKKIK